METVLGFLMLASVEAGVITGVHYVNGTCHVYVEGEDKSRKMKSTRDECDTLKGLVGFSIDSITDKEF